MSDAADTGLIVFARLDSTRLPAKVLRPLAGRALLGHVLDRARLIPGDLPLVVATSDRAVDDPIADFAASEGAAVFRGAAEDVVARALACARAHRLRRFARICGDSPFLDPDMHAELLAIHDRDHLDIATNIHPRGFPRGMSVEIVSTDALARLAAATDDPEDREHLTRYFYHRDDRFRVRNRDGPAAGYGDIRLVVDTPKDLALAEAILHLAGPKRDHLRLDDFVALARRAADRKVPAR